METELPTEKAEKSRLSGKSTEFTEYGSLPSIMPPVGGIPVPKGLSLKRFNGKKHLPVYHRPNESFQSTPSVIIKREVHIIYCSY